MLISGYVEAQEPTSLNLTAELDLFYYFVRGVMLVNLC